MIPRAVACLLAPLPAILACAGEAPPGGPAPIEVRSELGSVTVGVSAPELGFRNAKGSLVLSAAKETESRNDGHFPGALGFCTGHEPDLVPPELGTAEAPAPASPAHRHVATHRTGVRTEGENRVATFATDDPDGRELRVRVGTDARGTLRAEISVVPSNGVTCVHASFRAEPGEAFHGFGGRRESTSLRGHAFSTWVFDYRFPDVSTAYYHPQTAFLSSAGYGLWVETDALARFWMASERDDAWRVAVAASEMALIVAPGSPAVSLGALTAITGRHRVAPEWSMGPSLSRTIQIVGFTPESYREKVLADVERLVTGELPITSYAYEGWASLPREVVQQVNARLLAAGIRPMLYLRSFVANDAAGTEPRGRLEEAIAKGYVATRADGSPYLFPSPFDSTDAAVIDFTIPDARAFWHALVTEMLELGAEGFMNDFGEQVLPDMVFADGSTGETMHNRYPVLQHAVTRDAVDAFEAAHPGREIFFFGRAGYSGRPGSVAHENASFPGDETVDFDRYTGLPSIVPDMLNRAAFGGYGFSTDIGGYADFTAVDGKFVGTDRELFLRWSEAAVFTTHFRVHNSALSGLREPWAFGAETEATWKALADLHLRVVPLLRGLWAEAAESGLPPVRAMFLVDEAAWGEPHADDQWMVGRDVVVAPVLARGATEREVWLPEGCWQREGAGERLAGRQIIVAAAPLGTVPWFARCDAAPF